MKITAIEATSISIPYRVPWRNRHTEEAGRPMTHLETTILRVATDEGVEGLGEARGASVVETIARKCEPFLQGRDPTQISRLVPEMEAEFGQSTIVAGIDFALHDIKGKALGVPVYELLGGRCRERVPLVWTLPYLPIEDQVNEATARVAEGFIHAMKMKVGVPGDLPHIVAVARAVDPVPIRPDSNMGHSYEEALEQYGRLLRDGARLELVEDPCPLDWDDYQRLADALGVSLSVHGGWSTFKDLAGLIRASRPGIRCVNVMPSQCGIFRAAQIVAALECAGIGWTMGTSHDSGIKIAASFHLGVALPNHLFPADLLGPRLHAADLVSGAARIEGGYGYVPEGPGLGVSLDRDVLEEYRVPATGPSDRDRI